MFEVPVIRSSKLLEFPAVVFGMSTRQGGISPEPYGLNLSFNVGDERDRVIENRRRFFHTLRIGLEELAMPLQCNGNTVRRVHLPGGYENCDALVTSERGVYLVVTVADCIPVFMYDPNRHVVAAVHVGWRGAASGVIVETMRLLKEEFSSRPEDLVVSVGPSARACCYEVEEDVARKFPEQFLHAKSHGKFILDLHSFSKGVMIENGVRKERIEDNGRCTICTPELFHSYRRDGKHSGRMMGTIGLVR